jgi:hypothetical protein
MQSGPNQMTPEAVFLLSVFVIGFFCFTSYLSSILTGWHKLSRRFAAQSEPYGVTASAGPFFYTIYTRYWSHYSSCVRITSAEDALYFSVFILLRVGHPPLRISWSEIRFGRTRHFGRQYVVLTLGNQEQIPMRISERMAGKLGILERLPAES